MYKYTFSCDNLYIDMGQNRIFNIDFASCVMHPKIRIHGHEIPKEYFSLFGKMITDNSLYTGESEEDEWSCLGVRFSPNENLNVSSGLYSVSDFCKRYSITRGQFNWLYETVVQALSRIDFGSCCECV